MYLGTYITGFIRTATARLLASVDDMTLLTTRKTRKGQRWGGEMRRLNELRQLRMTSRNQQRHVTAAESPRWRDVINRDFPRNAADRPRGAGDKSGKSRRRAGVEHVCWTSGRANERTSDNNRRRSAPLRAAAGDTVHVGGVNHANALATRPFAWCASSLLFR